MGFKNIIFDKENEIKFVTLNRPEVYDTLNHEFLVELGEVI
jgi:enoyl-CoA hydratase/carnithine racemase